VSHIYLDWNATTPPHPEVLAAMRAAAEEAWANPASVHGPGRAARARVESAREAVARLVGLDARDVTLTSGGTEANNLALRQADGPIVLSRVEHPSLVRAAEALAERGTTVIWVDPSPSGQVPMEAVRAALDETSRAGTVPLLSLQAVNHETGVVQDVAAAAEIAHARGARLHVDAVQAAGRLDRAAWAGADLVTVAAHKIRGPKGIGALLTRPGIKLRPVLHGGSQERGFRPGTQDPIACAGFAVAAHRARETPGAYAALAPLRDRLEAELMELGATRGSPEAPPGAASAPRRNGDALRAPHVSNLSWPGWRGPELCAALDLEGVAVSSGSACSAGTPDPSPVITAMLGRERATSAVRVSLGEETTLREILEAISKWERVLSRAARVSLRGSFNVDGDPSFRRCELDPN
jgi:cysteine desulfurase